MKDLFKSLSESVSEACYEDIKTLVEFFINEIKKEDVDKISGELDREQLRAWIKGTEEEKKKANKRHDSFFKSKTKWISAKNSGKIKPYKRKDEKDEQK